MAEAQAPKVVSTSSSDALRCSFCGKPHIETKKLLAGPMVYICDGCIDLCNEILHEEVDGWSWAPASKAGLQPSTEVERTFWIAAALKYGTTAADQLIRDYRQRF